jgi:hypothetical protein
MGGGAGGPFLLEMSGRCIFKAPSFQVLFCFQFNGAPTERDYLQLFLAGRRIFCSRLPREESEEARRLLLDGFG